MKRFIEAHITTLEQLEILGFMLRYRSAEWTPEVIAARFRTSAATATARLVPLVNDGLVVRLSTDPPRYQYRPASPALNQTVLALMDAYGAQPAEVIAEICARPNVKNWPRRKP